jgi:putative FmdB family regulatory protein
MPLYEYECQQEGTRFEIIQKFSDAPLTTCPTCGGTVRRLLSSPAIQFKGSGWYITDYARKGKEGKESEAGATGSAESKPGDSKPAESKSIESKSAESKAAPSSSSAGSASKDS